MRLEDPRKTPGLTGLARTGSRPNLRRRAPVEHAHCVCAQRLRLGRWGNASRPDRASMGTDRLLKVAGFATQGCPCRTHPLGDICHE